MSKRTPLVYMVSRTALTCEHYAAGCTKTKAKILRLESSEKKKTYPIWAKKGETGCVLGAGGDGNGWKRMKTGGEAQSLNPNEHHSHATHAKRKPAKTQCSCRFCGRGRRTWSPLPLRSARSRAPLALARPSARGFGVDVGKHTRERGKGSVARFSQTSPETAVLIW